MDKSKKPRSRMESPKNDMVNKYYEENYETFVEIRKAIDSKISGLKYGRRNLDHNIPLSSKATKGALSTLVFGGKTSNQLSVLSPVNYRTIKMKHLASLLYYLKFHCFVIPLKQDAEHIDPNSSFVEIIDSGGNNLWLSDAKEIVEGLLAVMPKKIRLPLFKSMLPNLGDSRWFKSRTLGLNFGSTPLDLTLFYLSKLGFDNLIIDPSRACDKYSKIGLYESKKVRRKNVRSSRSNTDNIHS